MKIALFGYGKMGKMVEELAIERGHEVVLKIDVDNKNRIRPENLKQADAVIEFTMPDAAKENIAFCLNAGVPVVTGTTGWYAELPSIKELCAQKNGALLYASNFSIGVNILFALNKKLAQWMAQFPDYKVSIEEIHHAKKLDAPSGTALTLTEGVIQNNDELKEWVCLPDGDKTIVPDDTIPVYFKRIGEVPGYHEVVYTSNIDRLLISHEAFNRKGFALGAVMAAEFIQNKKGVFTTEDLFQLK